MAKKYTKRQADNASFAIFYKANKLMLDGFATMKEFQDISNIIQRMRKRNGFK